MTDRTRGWGRGPLLWFIGTTLARGLGQSPGLDRKRLCGAEALSAELGPLHCAS